jgi:phosphohistidine phosphatase SixA
MKLHIIRHAEAIERSTDLPDEQRGLTCRGRKRFRKVAAYLKKIEIAPDYILASPLVRAVQTAEILAETLRFNGELQICAALADGPDSAALGSLLRARNSAVEIVIVGHEPALGELVSTLLRLPAPCSLSKGCVVSLDITLKKSSLSAALLAMITGSGRSAQKPAEVIHQLLGDNQTSITADTHTWLAARQFLRQRADDFYLQLTLVREGFASESIHDLRVSSRRLRECIAIFSGCFRKRQLAPIRKELKSLITMLGAIRNCDEALLFFSELVEKCDPSASATVLNLVARLQKERVAELRRLKRELKKIDPGSLLGRIDATCSNPRIFNPGSDALFLPIAEYILAAVAAREKTILELLPEALVEGNVTAQHRLRIAVKHFRYGMEFLAPFAGSDYKTVYSTVKEYQELLGQMHDLDVFKNLIAASADESGRNSLLENIIKRRHKVLFNKFLRLHQAASLDKIIERVRGLL